MNPTKEQKKIIESTEGFQRCAAVPGSGKTFCLTHRIAFLIKNLYIDSSSIIGLTFTNKAASSMKKKLKDLVGDDSNCFMGTFHGFCNLILKDEIYRLSWPKTFGILDNRDQIDLIKTVTDEQNLELKDVTASNIMEKICARKLKTDYIPFLTGTDKEELIRRCNTETDTFMCIYWNYLLHQRDNYVLDFTDLIQMTLYIFEHFEDALKTWQDKCQYVLCDEYQDVSSDQEQLLSLISAKFGNLFVIGDDDQNIYGWRGSDVEYMINFDKRYPNVKDFPLNLNFRSTPEIVATASSLIKANKNRIPKKMKANKKSGQKPKYNMLPSEKEEGNWICDVINQKIGNGYRYDDFAILVRSSFQTRELEEAFVSNNIPYKIISGAKFYSSEEIRTTISYMRMVYDMKDIDFEKTINRPRRKFGKKSLDELKKYAASQNMSLFNALGDLIIKGKEKRTSLVDYYKEISRIHAYYEKMSCSDIANEVLDIGYRKELQSDVDQIKIDNVSELLSNISSLEKENDNPIKLEDLLAHYALFSAQDDDEDKNIVKVMTIHTAKGLEFNTVFIPGLVEGQFPSGKLQNEDQLEEERRLFYVAITRARHELFLSGYFSKTGSYAIKQSSFLGDIDPGLIECIGKSQIAYNGSNTELLPKADFKVGDKVIHEFFGTGSVTNVDVKSQTYEIQFEKIEGIRRLQFRAPLKASN
ncbi:MAG: UvrD-helicase domain-containing protein [Butyrivibrio sp.]|nr:UvrD-helicase domain-containing protein [Butyrivibrio sp.]